MCIIKTILNNPRKTYANKGFYGNAYINIFYLSGVKLIFVLIEIKLIECKPLNVRILEKLQ